MLGSSMDLQRIFKHEQVGYIRGILTDDCLKVNGAERILCTRKQGRRRCFRWFERTTPNVGKREIQEI